MNRDRPITNWDNVRARVRVDPFFLGWALDQYETAHQMTDQELAEVLGCNTRDLVRLSLCRLPDDSSPRFREEIHRISEYTPCNADRLVMLVREVIATKKMSANTNEQNAGFLMAARDRRNIGENTGDNGDNLR